ncbi:hypothetical protein Tco_0759599 [Tanacetum coccineum]
MVKNKGLVAEEYEWDEEDVSSDDNEMTEVKVLMALADDENVVVGKKSARNGEWVKISIRKLVIEYDSTDESSVCSIPLPPLEKLAGAEPVSEPNIIKSILKSNSTFKAVLLLKAIQLPVVHNYMFNDHLSDDYVNYPICDIGGSYDHDTHDHNWVISLRRGIKPRNPQQVTKSCETCGSTVHTITDHNDIKWFRKGKALQAKKVGAFQSKRT